MFLLITSNMNPNSEEFRRKALRDSVLCIAFMKFTGVTCYIILLLLVVFSKQDDSMGFILVIMLGLTVIPQTLTGVVLIAAVFLKSMIFLNISIVMVVLSSCYNALVGVLGTIYFCEMQPFNIGQVFMAIIFALWILVNLTSMCHDVTALFLYRKSEIDYNERE